MCDCSPQDVHDYGPCGETCGAIARTDWSYPKHEVAMKKYWVSWYSPADLWGKFELHSPWWVSGERCDDGAHTICAAIQAHTEVEAQSLVKECYDDCPPPIEWRFVEERPADWSPFNSRFQRAGWMKWHEEIRPQ